LLDNRGEFDVRLPAPNGADDIARQSSSARKRGRIMPSVRREWVFDSREVGQATVRSRLRLPVGSEPIWQCEPRFTQCCGPNSHAAKFDIIAELPKKDPDGFEYSVLWLVSLGRHAPIEMLLDIAGDPEFFLHHLLRDESIDERRLFGREDVFVTLLFVLLRGPSSAEEARMLSERIRRPALEEVCRVVRGQGAKCIIECDPMITVVADPERLQEVLDELATNTMHWLRQADPEICMIIKNHELADKT
jgi:hypothetical protein